MKILKYILMFVLFLLFSKIYSQKNIADYYIPPLSKEYKYITLNKDDLFSDYIYFNKEGENLFYKTIKCEFKSEKVTKFITYFKVTNKVIIKVKHFNLLFNYSESSEIVVFKQPNATWKYYEKDESGEKIVEHIYKSKYGSTKTEYGSYDDCIIITRIPKALNPKYKDVTAYIDKNYYAYGVGLVKHESINKETEEILSLTSKVLVDIASRYSYSFIKKQEEKVKEKKYIALISKADSLLKLCNYSSAKQIYNDALTIRPIEYYPSNKISEINNILIFLKERKTKIYDYKQLNNTDYNSIYSSLVQEIKSSLKSKNFTGTAKINLTYNIDTIGINNFEFKNIKVINQDISNTIQTIAIKYHLKPVHKNGYIVNAQAKYDINIFMDEKIFYVKKNNIGTTILNETTTFYKSDINSLISSGPIGKYTISIKKKEINDIDFSNNKVTKYKGIGGPSNIFLSMLVPGFGVKGVTGGSKSGLSRTICTYVFIANGIGCKFLSNSEYEKYHKATEQTEMDEYYKSANFFNKSFYILAGTGAIIWLYDIIWVANKGFQNRKEQKQYKRQLSLNYDNNTNSIYLGYTINF